ncbi:MAG: hypothetical protein ACRDL4_10370 [Thermoleophilaceae bacterium]
MAPFEPGPSRGTRAAHRHALARPRLAARRARDGERPARRVARRTMDGTTRDELDRLIEDITVDCYNEDSS